MKTLTTFLMACGLLFASSAFAELLHRGMGVGLFQSGTMGHQFTVYCTPKDPSYALYREKFNTQIALKGYVYSEPGSKLNASCHITTSPKAYTGIQVIPTSQPNKSLIRGYFSIMQKRSEGLPPLFRVICNTYGSPGNASVSFAMGMTNFTKPGFIGLNFSCNLTTNGGMLMYDYR